MEKLVTVEVETIISYQCECPNCGETIYSEYQDDWDIYEMVYSDQKITCTDCDTEFMVSL